MTSIAERDKSSTSGRKSFSLAEASPVIDSSLLAADLSWTGRAGFVDFFSKMWKQPKPVEATLRNPPALVVAEGDLVTLVFKRQIPEPTDTTKRQEAFWFDVLRVKDGKLVEQWDNATKPTK